jgi:hypothetical protein
MIASGNSVVEYSQQYLQFCECTGVLIIAGIWMAFLTKKHLCAVQCVTIIERISLYSALVANCHVHYEWYVVIILMAVHISSVNSYQIGIPAYSIQTSDRMARGCNLRPSVDMISNDTIRCNTNLLSSRSARN